jgi:exonuclease III
VQNIAEKNKKWRCLYIYPRSFKIYKHQSTKHCKEQDIEIAAIQIKFNDKNVIILCVYRAPSGNYDYFLNKLDNILNALHNYKTEFIVCGNINISYLEINNKKKQLHNLLCTSTYNLIGTVHFPTRIVHNSATLIDNIFIDNRRNYTIKQCINGLPDHDAQLITLNQFGLQISTIESI